MFMVHILSCFLAASSLTRVFALRPAKHENQLYSTRLVYEFPLGTSLENIAIRSNGQILVTAFTGNELYLLDSIQNGPPVVVHKFTNSSSLSGIAEYSEDVFAVLVGASTGAKYKTWSVWSVDLRGVNIQADNSLNPAPTVSKIVTIPEGQFMNGMSLLSSSEGLLLAADALSGVIRVVNVHTGEYALAANNTLTAPGPAPYIGFAGTNGIRVHSGSVYLVNRATYAKISTTPQGTPLDCGSVIAHGYNSSVLFDDFAIDCKGTGYLVTGPGNSIEKISSDGSFNRIVVGSLNSTVLAEPTSAAFGRTISDSNILYVTTGGALLVPVNGKLTTGGQLVAVTTNTRGCFSLEPYY